jgi:hypothetical protein
MGVLASKMPTEEFPIGDVFRAIEWVYGHDFKTESGKRAECTENAISTFGKCIYYHGGNLSAEAITLGFLDRLPLTTDPEEAPVAHALFLTNVAA